LPNGASLLLEPLVRSRYRLGLEDFDPCAVLLNNDLTAGIPDILQNLNEQFILPPLHAGWATRRKSNHFAAYDEVAERVRQAGRHRPLADQPVFLGLRQYQFPRTPGRGLPGRQRQTRCSTLIREKYKEYGIDETPTWWSRPTPAPTAWA
jgi:glutamate--cysteine ligase